MNKPTNPKDIMAIGKVGMSVLPAQVMLEVATAMAEGACKYGLYNYRSAGVRASIYYDATLRHLIAWWEGEDIDDASSLSHITKAISSLVVLRDAMLNDTLTDDRPPRPKVQIGEHIESLNEICASLIERHKGADVTHYTHADLGGVVDTRVENYFPTTDAHPDAWDEGEKRINNIARSHGDGEHYEELQPTPTFDESANFDVVPDMSDPRNWKPGDIVRIVGESSPHEVVVATSRHATPNGHLVRTDRSGARWNYTNMYYWVATGGPAEEPQQ